MKKGIYLFSFLITIFSLMVGKGYSEPITIIVNRLTISVAYFEPTTNEDGTELKDLAKTAIYADKGQGRILLKEMPASSVTGGEEIKTVVGIPAKTGDYLTMKVWATAFDLKGNESEPSEIIEIIVDLLPPTPPK